VLLDKEQKQRDLKINEQNQGKKPGTTVVQKLNQGSPRTLGDITCLTVATVWTQNKA
jgi:hypothetical protein